jgi:type IV pilus assembly protein PilW
VMTVRVNLLARNLDKTTGYSTNQTYDLGKAGTVGPFTDGYRRRVFSEVIRAVNPSARRE